MSDSSLPPEGPNPTAASTSDSSGLAPNIAAGLACLFSLIGGVIFLVLEKKDHFVRLWAMQSAFLGALGVAVSIVVKFAYLVFGHLPLIGGLLVLLFSFLHLIFSLAWFIVYVITIVKAFSEQTWEIPWLGKLARKQLEQLDSKNLPPV